MIIRSGSHICEYCNHCFEWESKKIDDDAYVILGAIGKGLLVNVDFFGVVNGCRLIATGRCPNCKKKLLNNLVDEPWPQ